MSSTTHETNTVRELKTPWIEYHGLQEILFESDNDERVRIMLQIPG